jgi:hypothetical protein
MPGDAVRAEVRSDGIIFAVVGTPFQDLFQFLIGPYKVSPAVTIYISRKPSPGYKSLQSR